MNYEKIKKNRLLKRNKSSRKGTSKTTEKYEYLLNFKNEEYIEQM
jgi:hypothetical protein